MRRIIAKTEELGIDDNTIILYFHDNGPARPRWNAGLMGRKGSIDEGGIRSPLFMKWPNGIKAGKEIERLVSVIDLLLMTTPTQAYLFFADEIDKEKWHTRWEGNIDVMMIISDDLRNELNF